MPLTITINEAAPGTLTIGVGTPGVGVPAGGSAGQVLTKVDGTDFNTVFATPSADYITAVTAPLSVTSGNLSVNLSTYLPLAGGTMNANATVDLSDTVTGTVSEVGGYGFAVSSAVNANLKTNVLFDRVLVGNATSTTTLKPTGVEFPDLTLQTSAGISAATAAATYAVIAAGQPTSGTVGQVLTKNSGTNYDSSWATLITGDRYLTTSTTSNTISNGNKTFTIGTGLSYTPTQDVTIAYDASKHMHAEVTTYNSGTGVLVVDVKNHTGSGTFAAWTVNVGGVTPLASVAWGSITGTLSTQTDLQNALDLKANLASPSFTGNVSITSSSGAALFIEQTGAGNILTLHDQASDTTFVTIDANGKVSTIASEATNGAGFNIAHGVAPTTPVNGDIWTTTAGLFARISGSTKTYANLNDNNVFTNANSTYGFSTGTGTTSLASGSTVSASTKTVNVATGGVSGSTTLTTIGPVLGASTTSIGNTTAASTLNLATGATLTATTKAVNIGTAGVAGSTTNIAIGSTTGTSTTTLQGTTNGITAAVDTNSVALATTAFVIGQASSTTPSATGTAAIGTSLSYARADHVHVNPLPSGGTTGQVLSKVDGTSYNVAWTTPSAGGVPEAPIDDYVYGRVNETWYRIPGVPPFSSISANVSSISSWTATGASLFLSSGTVKTNDGASILSLTINGGDTSSTTINFSSMTSLVTLNLYSLSSMTSTPSFSALSGTLQNVAIIGNSAMTSGPSFSGFTYLSNASVSSNTAMTSAPVFSAALTIVAVNNNYSMTSAPSFNGFGNITQAQVNGNLVMTSAPDFSGCSSMTSVDCSGNTLMSATPNLSSCVSLTAVNCNNNPAMISPPSVYQAAYVLNSINMSYNTSMTSAPSVSGCGYLSSVNLSNCAISNCDSILSELYSNGYYGGFINISGGTNQTYDSSALPSSITNLQSIGWGIVYNYY